MTLPLFSTLVVHSFIGLVKYVFSLPELIMKANKKGLSLRVVNSFCLGAVHSSGSMGGPWPPKISAT